MKTVKECLEPLNQRSASLFLALLLCGDLAFFVLHLINALPPIFTNPLLIKALAPIFRNPLMSLEIDNGYPEMYQYLKFFWIIIILIFASLKNASLHYVPWALVFAYFLLDDALGVHEKIGWHIRANLSFVPDLGLRPQDYGELAVSTAAGIILFFPLVWAYRNGSGMFRKISQDFALLILVLVFFGVVVDMAHIAIKLGEKVQFVLGIIEDGGEMLSVSLILWYAFLMMVRNYDSGCYLCDCLRTVLTRRSITAGELSSN